MLTGHGSRRSGSMPISGAPMPNRRLGPARRSSATCCRGGCMDVDPATGRRSIAACSGRCTDPWWRGSSSTRSSAVPRTRPDAVDQIRPWWGHNYHFHIGLSVREATRCCGQAPPPAGDGCGRARLVVYRRGLHPPPSPPAKPLSFDLRGRTSRWSGAGRTNPAGSGPDQWKQ